MESLLFTPAKIGPIEIKNRVIRASAYEGMCDGPIRLWPAAESA